MAFYPNRGRSTLSDSDRRMLYDDSGIDPGVVEERGYYTARRRSEVPEAFKDYQRKRGLVVPMHSPDGETVGYQLRPDRPRKGGPKYETPGGASPVVDVHPRMLEEIRHGDGPLLITEGAKTGDAATSRGIPTVVLAGVWMWCVPKVKPYRLKPCFDHIRLEGREVIVVFDSDCMSKANVQDSLAALVVALEDRGAVVKVIHLPDAADGSKQGIDDYLVAGGTVREMFMLAREFDPADVGRIRMSKDEKLRAAVEDLKRRFWATEWKGMGGASSRDVYLKLIEAAKKSGTVHADGIRVVKAQGPLALEAKVSGRTLWKALNRLEEWGLLYRDNEGRKPDKSGAFVLRASVSHKGSNRAGEGNATTRLQACDPGDLHLRAPRQRWSSPPRKRQPRYGMVPDTRRIRSKPTTEVRVPNEKLAGVKRLGKIRGAILDALDVAGGSGTLREIAAILHRKRPRDIRRRMLPMLEEAGVIVVTGDVVTLAADWLEALERETDHEPDERARRNYERRRDGYRAHRAGVSAASVRAVKVSRERRAEHLADQPPPKTEPPPPLSPLAVAVRDYLDKIPRDARQPPGWIGSTLWALELFDGKPTPAEARAAIEELGGAAYLNAKLMEAKDAA